jgi:hypothetical protein
LGSLKFFAWRRRTFSFLPGTLGHKKGFSQLVHVAAAPKGIGHSQDRAAKPAGKINLHQVFAQIIPGAVARYPAEA